MRVPLRPIATTEKLIDKLLIGGADDVQDLEAIEASGEVAAVPYLAMFALKGNAGLLEQVAAVADRLLQDVTANTLLAFDQHLRSYAPFPRHYQLWNRIKPEHLSLFNSTTAAYATALLGVCSMHPNGYVREAAVRRLALSQSGAELPFLLIRLNDWVDNVRSRARQALQERMTPTYVVHFARNVVMLERVASWSRTDHSTFLRWVNEYLRLPQHSAAIKEVLREGDAKTRRLLYQLLAHAHAGAPADLLREALGDPDPTIRSWSIAQASRVLEHSALLPIAASAVRDRYSAVRRQAAYIYAEHFPGQAQPILTELLMDEASALRALARFYLSVQTRPDFAAFYRDKLRAPTLTHTAIAIRALGETGAAADADRIEHYADHSDRRIQEAAIYALSKLDGERFVGRFCEALFEGSPSVAKAAYAALAKHRAGLDEALLWKRAQQTVPETRKRILALLFQTSKWDSLYYALITYDDAVPAIASMAQDKLHRWIDNYNRSGGEATPEQRARIQEALRANASMPEALVKQLRFLLGP